MRFLNGIIVKAYNYLIARKWINTNNKICRRMRAMLYHNICYECKASFGNKNKNRTFYVIRCPQAEMGFFAVINYVIYHLDKARNIGAEPVVDWKFYPNKYFTEDYDVGKVNVWESFFEQPSHITLDEVYQSKNVIMSSGSWEVPIKEVFDNVRLAHSNEIVNRYIVLNEKTKKMFEAELDRVGIKKYRVLGVKCRGTDFIATKPYSHQIVPDNDLTIKTVDEKIKEWGGFERIYLSTEDESILEKMKSYYGEKLWYTEGTRILLKENKWLSELYDCNSSMKGTKEEDMREYLISTYMLASCDALIAPEVGGTLGAMRIRGTCDNSYIFQLGTY